MKKLFIILATVAMVFVSCKKENCYVHCFMDGRDTDMVEGIQSCYDSHTPEHKNTDEFMEPLVNSNVDGRIKDADVAPTILHIMGLGQPQEMTGQRLINE